MAAGSLTLGGNLSIALGPLGRNGEAIGSVSTGGKVAAMYSPSSASSSLPRLIRPTGIAIQKPGVSSGEFLSKAPSLLSDKMQMPRLTNLLSQSKCY